MAKRAVIVEFNIRTRVIVDDEYPAGMPVLKKDDETFMMDAIAAGREKILNDVHNYVIADTAFVEDDIEVPFDPKYDK